MCPMSRRGWTIRCIRASSKRVHVDVRYHVHMAGLPDVLPVAEARESLSKVLDRFRRQGRDARPVFFGSRRQAEAVIIPMELFEEILPLIEDALIARDVRSRLDRHDGKWVDFDTLAQEAGVDPAAFD